MDRLDSVKMLSSAASQYLSPDYLQPLPTTLDAKNSPLALLAQTCNSIGKDPPSKAIIPSVEKKESKSSSPDSRKATPPSKSREGRSSTEKHRISPKEPAKDIQNFYPLSTSSPKPEKGNFAAALSPKQEPKMMGGNSKPAGNIVPSPKPNTMSSNSDRISPRTSSIDTTKDTRDHRDHYDRKGSPSLKRPRSESPPPARREYSPGHDSKHLHGVYPGYGHIGLAGLPYGAGAIQATPEMLAAVGYPYVLPQNGLSIASAHASALAAHQAALKGSSSAALAQYMQYARMRNPSLSSPCKDPYCTNCLSASVQPGHLPSQCSSPGCAQCSQDKAMQGLNMFGLPVSSALHSSYSASNLSSASAGLSTLHNLYTQNLLNQQQQGHPHVCNWMSGSDYCGKRFSTSEELLQHLRTHTSGGESALSASYGLGLSFPPSAELSSLPAYLNSVNSLSPESLRRMYPGSLSPLGNSALASRFHPYKSSMSGVPQGLPPPQSLGPYYSPYNIYGQRIGAAAVP